MKLCIVVWNPKSKIDKDSIQFTLLFTTLFLQLPSCENHDHGAATTPKTTLDLWKDVAMPDVQTDGQMKLAWHIRAIAYMLSRVKNGS